LIIFVQQSENSIMKKLVYFLLLAFIISVPFGCEPDTEEIIAENSLSVSIDGELWKSDTVYVNYSQLLNITLITADRGNGNEQINLSFYGKTTGSYPFSTSIEPQFGNYIRNSTKEVYSSANVQNPVGQIIVTEYDHANHWLSGKFYFDSYDSIGNKKVFTGGEFNKLIFSD
jgi:hypothetical protein